MGDYTVSLEVSGPAAIWTRPDTGGTPTSYLVPTWSAAKGIFESIAFFSDGAAWICPTKVEICRFVGKPGGMHFQKYTTNYGGPLRKGSLFAKGLSPGGSGMQFFATILSDVCYRLHGCVMGNRPLSQHQNNSRHHLKDLFDRRLKRGQCYRTPCLGWSEFICSYWGPFRQGVTEVDATLDQEIPSMLLGVWSTPFRGHYEPTFRHNASISRGELTYEIPASWLSYREETEDAQ